jgi:hypothetical protein
MRATAATATRRIFGAMLGRLELQLLPAVGAAGGRISVAVKTGRNERRRYQSNDVSLIL